MIFWHRPIVMARRITSLLGGGSTPLKGSRLGRDKSLVLAAPRLVIHVWEEGHLDPFVLAAGQDVVDQLAADELRVSRGDGL